MAQKLELRLPELGFEKEELRLSLWLVDVGSQVTEGDRLVEILAGPATVDLPSPGSGKLAAVFADEDERVTPGQLLAQIECEESEEGEQQS